MKLRHLLAGALIGAFLLALAPAPRAMADGAASTRNILMGLGAAAATLIIINHNKQVHAKYAQDAARQAALENQRNDAEAAYRAEERAYRHELAVSEALQHEVAVKDRIIAQQNALIERQKQQLAQLGISQQPVAVAPVPAVKTKAAQHPVAQMISYGWGTL
jgi:hypothetical protein